MLAKILAQLVVSILQWGAAREDFRHAIKEELKNEAMQQALEALAWKADAATHPDRGAGIRVRDGAKIVRIPGHDSDIPVSASRMDRQ